HGRLRNTANPERVLRARLAADDAVLRRAQDER
ncbi:MAG: hypothetical protein QOD51_1579, partial [Candidatus Eremiobacteraeota bacterium]|nr:hypothetical protein [Candidatus Eremiobacteraeota bacterium]